MNEISLVSPTPKRKRYTKAFKQNVIGACAQPGASVARIALEHGLNANMLRKWIRLAQSKSAHKAPGFVALPINTAPVEPAPMSTAKRAADEAIRVEIPYRQQSINISWPVSQTDRCLALLRELLR
jgi:transposase-like protein